MRKTKNFARKGRRAAQQHPTVRASSPKVHRREGGTPLFQTKDTSQEPQHPEISGSVSPLVPTDLKRDAPDIHAHPAICSSKRARTEEPRTVLDVVPEQEEGSVSDDDDGSISDLTDLYDLEQ